MPQKGLKLSLSAELTEFLFREVLSAHYDPFLNFKFYYGEAMDEKLPTFLWRNCSWARKKKFLLLLLLLSNYTHTKKAQSMMLWNYLLNCINGVWPKCSSTRAAASISKYIFFVQNSSHHFYNTERSQLVSSMPYDMRVRQRCDTNAKMKKKSGGGGCKGIFFFTTLS